MIAVAILIARQEGEQHWDQLVLGAGENCSGKVPRLNLSGASRCRWWENGRIHLSQNTNLPTIPTHSKEVEDESATRLPLA